MSDDTRFSGFEFVKEYPKALGGKAPIRIYRSRFLPTDITLPITSYRYHVGFPEFAVRPLCPLVECEPYWGEKHWKVEDQFLIWFTTITGKVEDGLPEETIRKHISFLIDQAKNVIAFMRRTKKEKP